MTPGTDTLARRAVLHEQLHRRFAPRQYDNWVVWAGNLRATIDGVTASATLARAWIGPDHPQASATVQVELFVAAVDPLTVRQGDVQARLWTDANQRGTLTSAGTWADGVGRYLPMRLVTDHQGVPVLAGQNLVFAVDGLVLHQTGAFAYTVEFSASDPAAEQIRPWVGLNEMADNRDGVIVVSPTWVRQLPTVTEVCARKVGARVVDGRFVSGTLRQVTAALPDMPADVVYLLPFFTPGCGDLHSGQDVRKGELGSVYAVQDFHAIDPALVTPLEQVDLPALLQAGLLVDADLADTEVTSVAALAGHSAREAAGRLGCEAMTQLVGRAELRQLTRRAHALGKRVIFDLVLMQTSRDNPLIETHPEFYLLDANGVPRIHQIAWLVYSDVALFDLVHNQPLQAYLLEIAPYWLSLGELDGVRIDASQTVDRPFLRRLKNRIQAVRPDALVLGETLCPLEQAVDVPVDMVYALLVDYHRDMEHAQPLIEFLEEMHRRYAPGTVALAYFENHDSPRATRIWRDRFAARLASDQQAAWRWRHAGRDAALCMALLKNAQASLIDLSAGLATGVNLAAGLEFGSWWGEMVRTDFENPTRLEPEAAAHPPQQWLVRAYERLFGLAAAWPELRRGRVYYHRHTLAGGDPEDRVLAYTRFDEAGALLFLHNLDPAQVHAVAPNLEYLGWAGMTAETLFDTYAELGLAVGAAGGAAAAGSWALHPLQSLALRLRRSG